MRIETGFDDKMPLVKMLKKLQVVLGPVEMDEDGGAAAAAPAEKPRANTGKVRCRFLGSQRESRR